MVKPSPRKQIAVAQEWYSDVVSEAITNAYHDKELMPDIMVYEKKLPNGKEYMIIYCKKKQEIMEDLETCIEEVPVMRIRVEKLRENID